MALVTEDGTGVGNANSYGTIAGARSYASDRGVTLGTDPAVTSQLINAADYLETFDYVGQKKTVAQALAWPRSNVMNFDLTPFPDNAIPQCLVNAQYQAVIDQAAGIELEPSIDGSAGFVTEEKVDVLMTKYSEIVGTSKQPFLPKVYNLLRGIIVPGPMLRAVRG